jgi:hypothetical protein
MADRTEFTEAELETAREEIRRRDDETRRQQEQQRIVKVREEYQRTAREIDEKYITRLGVTPEEFRRLEDIFYDYFEEREQRL